MKQFRKLACLALAALIGTGSAQPAPAASIESAKPTIQERLLLEAPEGTLVVVRLFSKEKVRGRVAEINEDGFALQVVNKDRIEKREIEFKDVKKLTVKKEGSGMSTGAKVLIGALAGAGVVILVAAVAAAAAY